MKHLRPLIEKKPKGAPDWHDSDAPDANGRFKDLSIKDLAAWLIKTRKKDVKRISGSLTQQIVFNRNDDPKYAEKMEKTRKEVYKQLGREDLLESLVIEKREDVGKYNTVKKVIKELGRRPSEQELATFINNNYYDVTEVERGDDDPTANDKIADLVGFYKFDIDDWEIAWFDAQNESMVTEGKIKYVKGKTYQSEGHWTVYVDSNSSGFDIRVNHSAGWRLDPHDKREETLELLDNGRQRATLYFKSGNIDKFAQQMFDINDRTTNGNQTKLTAKDYADIIRVWIDMKKANESIVNEASKDKMIRQIERALKDGLSIFKLPMATQKYYNKNKGDFEVVAEKGYNMEDIYDLIAFHRFDTDFRKLSSKDKEWVENDAAERGFNESLLESDIVDKYYSLIDELYEAKPGPDAYMTGLSDKEKEEKEAKMKKQAEMDDDDPDSYEELPGDEEARESGKVKKSKHTTAYNKKFKSESMKNLKSFDNFVTEKRSDLWSPFQKADILAGDMFGAMGLYRLEDDELDQIIDLKKADKLAKKMFGEFGFKTLAAKEMEDLLDNNPKLLRESQVNEFYFENDEEERLQKFVDQLSFGDELEYRDGFSTGRGSFPNTRELKKELDSNFQLLLTQKSGRNWDLYVGSDDLVFIIQPDLGAKNYMQISISSTKEQWNDESSVFARSNGYSVYESVVNEFGPMTGSGNRNYSTNDLVDRIGDLDDILMSDRKSEREWEEMSQNYLDGEKGSEHWEDLGDQELQDAINDAESLMKKYRIKESVVTEKKKEKDEAAEIEAEIERLTKENKYGYAKDIKRLKVRLSAVNMMKKFNKNNESVVTEAKAYKLKASEFGSNTFSAAYNVKGETTWRVHSTYAIDQVSGENNPEERDVVFFEAMPINNDIYIKIGGINNLKRTNGSTYGNNFGTTIDEWKIDPKGIAKEASDFLTDATHLKWINKKARSEGQVIKWALKDDYSSVIEDLVNKSLGLSEEVVYKVNNQSIFSDIVQDFEDFVKEKKSLNEASRRKVHKAAKQGSYPAVIVVVQDGKVIHQEPVSTPDVAPATFNVMQEKYPKALLHLEDKTGKRLFSEAKRIFLSKMDESKQSDELAIAINTAIEKIDDSMSYVDFAQAVGKVIRDEYGTHLYKEFEKEINKSLKESAITEAKLTRGLKPLLTIGSTITKKDGEDALLDLSDKFDSIDDEYAGTIASWLDMAIELMQDGYSGDATKKLKQFNKACKDVLNGKEVGSAFESVTENRMLRKGQFRFGAKLQYGIEDVNESYGFYGTLLDQFGLDEVNELYLDGFSVLGTNYDFTDQAALYYLNSKAGRWVADQVVEKLIGPKNMSPYYGHLEEIFAEYAKKGQWKKWSKEYDQFAEEDNMEEGLMIKESRSDRDEYYRGLLEAEQTTNDQSPLGDDGMETGINNKAKESGVPVGLLRIIMRRGLAAWKTGHRPGATQAQWGYARVNSFLTKQPGTWGKADSDIAKKVRDGGHDKDL